MTATAKTETAKTAVAPIKVRRVLPQHRAGFVPRLGFGCVQMGMEVEDMVYQIIGQLCPDYGTAKFSGYWEFYKTSNGSYFMEPHVAVLGSAPATVTLKAGEELVELDPDAAGITVMLLAYLRAMEIFTNALETEYYGGLYQGLLEYARQHKEAVKIGAIIPNI